MASDIKVNNIKSYSGNTLNLGDTGDTINLTGASFNGTSSVIWDTTVKTTDFTGSAGQGYFVNTTSAAVTVTLPASPSAGDIVAISDYAGTAATNNITVGRNGEPIGGINADAVIETNKKTVFLIYIDGTQGWLNQSTGDSFQLAAEFVAATGGTITTDGDFKVHTFDSSGTFTVTNAGNVVGSNSVDYMVIAGGGGGGSSEGPNGAGGGGGGGGAGGYRTNHPSPATGGLSVSAQAYPITIGGGGSGGDAAPANRGNPGNRGSNSVFSTITSTGGGAGGGDDIANPNAPGGSGGGGDGDGGSDGGSGNTPSVSPPQGNNGGDGGGRHGGGGGGAGEAGDTDGQAAGGDGSPNSITGSNVTYAGGGGGGAGSGPAPSNPGGTGGGGTGCGAFFPGQNTPAPNGNGTAGSANTGGGGGGLGAGFVGNAYAGGSGKVVIRYKFQ
jgi:hypothetical protein